MGMTGEIRALTERQIEVLLDNQDRVWDVAFGDENEENTNEKIEVILGEPLREKLHLDKSWDILRFLLFRAAGHPLDDDGDDPSSDLVFGEDVGDEPAAYYGPYLRSVEDTRELADFLRSLTADELLSHFNWQEMRKASVNLIWGDVADPERERDLREYAGKYFEALRAYVIKAADSQCGLLLWVS